MSGYIRIEDAVNIAESYEVKRDGFHLNDYEYGRTQVASSIAGDLEDVEPADVVPVVHGEWLNAIFDSKHYRCSICNYHISNLVRENYCPNCGAKMDREE